MHLAIIADVHGNLAALDAVLEDVERLGVDKVVCLGDVAATGPQPRETLERVRRLGCPVVLGNTDAFLLDPRSSECDDEHTRRFKAIDQWCAEQLTSDDLEYVASFQSTVALPLSPTIDMLCFHGSPRSFNDKISATTPDRELAIMLAGQHAPVLAGGHWHFQLLRRYQDMIILNPGSVGLAFDLSPARFSRTYEILATGSSRVPARAEYATLTASDGKLGIELRRVPYDRDATVQAMYERSMPYAEWWSAGWR